MLDENLFPLACYFVNAYSHVSSLVSYWLAAYLSWPFCYLLSTVLIILFLCKPLLCWHLYTLSRAETDRLIEIITSRAIDLPNVKRDERNLEFPSREEAKKDMSFFDKRKEPISGKDANSELWTTPTPLAKSIVSCLLSSLFFLLGLSDETCIYMSCLCYSSCRKLLKV